MEKDNNKKILECFHCGERKPSELYIVLPLKTSKYFVVCRYCSGLNYKHNEDIVWQDAGGLRKEDNSNE